MSEPLIVVIDDDAAIVNLLKEDLQGEGYRVLEGFDGQKALDLAASKHPRLLIIDMNMPGISGADVIKRLGAQDSTRKIPVLLLTGEVAGQRVTQLPEHVVHVEKPIDLVTLNRLVKETLKKYPS